MFSDEAYETRSQMSSWSLMVYIAHWKLQDRGKERIGLKRGEKDNIKANGEFT